MGKECGKATGGLTGINPFSIYAPGGGQQAVNGFAMVTSVVSLPCRRAVSFGAGDLSLSGEGVLVSISHRQAINGETAVAFPPSPPVFQSLIGRLSTCPPDALCTQVVWFQSLIGRLST